MCLPLCCSFVLNHESISHCHSSVPYSRLLSLRSATLSRLCFNIRICMLLSIALYQNPISYAWESMLITQCYSDHLIRGLGPSAQCYHRRKGRDRLEPYSCTSDLKIQIKRRFGHPAILIHTLTLACWSLLVLK